jgi:hypothetical protein
MNGFYESLKFGDEEFFKTAGIAVRYDGKEIRGVAQPSEEGKHPAPGGMAKTAEMLLDVMNDDVKRLAIRSGRRVEVRDMAGDWQTWLIDMMRPSAWTTTLVLMPKSGQQGRAAEF